MGTTGALGMVEAVDRGWIDQEGALRWHLTTNHFPPHPEELIPVAIKAIELAQGEEWEENVDLPENIEWKDGRIAVHAWEVIESLHLDSFL